MNYIISNNIDLKIKIEIFLNKKNINVFILLKTDSYDKIIDSIDKFLLLNKKCYEDNNIIAIYSKDFILKKHEYINFMKKEKDCIKIRNKLVKYENFFLN